MIPVPVIAVRHIAAITSVLVLLISSAGTAHVGQVIYPIYELPSSDLPVFHDGSFEDWEQALPNASLTHEDFAFTDGTRVGADDFAFRVFLAWHTTSQTIFMGIEMLDDIYLPPKEGGIGNGWVRFAIDGDHTGGEYLFPPGPDTSEQESIRTSMAQAQYYAARPEALYDGLLSFLPDYYWIAEPPWGDVAGFQYGDAPNLSGIELRVTPWDKLDWLDPEASQRSQLEPGKIVGFGLEIADADEPNKPSGIYTLDGSGLGAVLSADLLVDGELLPCFVGDCSGRAASVVKPNAWALIKAGLR